MKTKNNELSSMTKKELLKFAEKNRIEVNNSALKEELIDTISLCLKGKTKGSLIEKKKRGERIDKREETLGEEKTDMQKWGEYVEEKKYTVYPSHTYEGQTREASEIPAGYGDNKIVLMVRDPYWLHSYWEIRDEKIREGLNKLGATIDEITSIVRVYDVTSINFNGKNPNSFFDIVLSGNANNWYIHVGNPNRSYCAEIGLRDKHGNFFVLARSNIVTTPRAGISEVIDEEWMTIEPDYSKMYALSGGFRKGADSLELKEMLEKHLEQEMASGAVSSFGSGELMEKKKRGFWFVLDTELIVYGATEPGATVTLQGKRLSLRADGTFTARFALPDGRQIIPVTAKSPDGIEERTITPIVSRDTERPKPTHR